MSNLEELKRWIHNNSAKHAKRRKRRHTLDPWAPFHRLRIDDVSKTHLQRLRIPDDRMITITLQTKEDEDDTISKSAHVSKSRHLRIENDPKTNLRRCLWAAVVLLVFLYAVIYFLY